MDLFSKESGKIGGQIQLHLPFRRIYKFELINAVFLLSFLWPKRLDSNLPLSFRRALKHCLLFMLFLLLLFTAFKPISDNINHSSIDNRR